MGTIFRYIFSLLSINDKQVNKYWSKDTLYGNVQIQVCWTWFIFYVLKARAGDVSGWSAGT